MKNFRFIFVSLIILAVLGLVGYWAFATLEPGGTYASRQQIKNLEERNEELEEEVVKLKSELSIYQAEEEVEALKEEVAKEETSTSVATSEHQKLINELQKLVDDNVYMKQGSRGTRVGTVQTFLNIYFNTTKKVDNDYGASTKTDIIKFQKAEGLTADGEAGPTTFQKMIDWLRKQ